MNQPKTFALDFDDTYTADPSLMAAFVKMALARGHKFYCVTARRDIEANVDDINEAFDEYGIAMPIIFSNLGSKMEEVKRRGIKIDIWIDDAPFAIVHGH